MLYINVAEIAHLLVLNKQNQWSLAIDLNVYCKNQQFRFFDCTKRRRNNSLLQSNHFSFHQNLEVSYFETLKKKSIVTYNTELSHLPILYLDKNYMKFKIKNSKTLITFEHYSKTLDSINYHLKCYFVLNKSIVFTSKSNETDSLASENNYVNLSAPEIKQFTQYVQKMITANKNHEGFIRQCVRGNYNNDLLFFNIGGNYRFCTRKDAHHQSNTTSILINKRKLTYAIRCKDPQCNNTKFSLE
ncbi:unnamed protein product [Rotaria sp. Silwood2]|nr:unnamed protein product [Rotaria sp. Silwood2]CAF4633463.1 unnamed protein product [Rotaria sp. Silwood2]